MYNVKKSKHMKLNYYIYSLVASVLLVFSACTPEEYEMGGKTFTSEELVEGVAYTVTHDADNPNIVYLKSLLGPEYTPLWEHPQGRSQEAEVTLQIAFEGTYEVTFGVETRGGVVYGAPSTFTIDNFCADFVTGEMWDLLAGGAGNSKTWVPDNGSYGLQQGFYTCFDPSATYADMIQSGSKWTTASKTWWEPSNADAGVTEDDLMASMTFSLQGNAGLSVTTYKGGAPTTQEGLFSMNTSNHTISAIDVDFAHGAWADGKAVDFRNNFQILVLTENQLMIGNYRDEAMSGEGRCVYCWNFVSKDYADNYEAPVVEVYPTLPADWRDYVEPKTNQIITYVLDEKKPFDWCNPDGTLKNVASTAAAGIDGLELELNSRESTYKVTTPDGQVVEGTYTLSADGIYTFSAGLPEVTLSADGRAVFKLGGDNALRIMQIALDDYSGSLSDLWLGGVEQDAFGHRYQYMGYHFVPKQEGEAVERFTASLHYFNSTWGYTPASADVYITGDGTYTFVIEGADSDPYGVYLDVMGILGDYPNVGIVITDIKVDGNSVAFDDSVIERGIGDDADTARRYIVNPWNENTAGDAGKYAFASSIEVTIQVTMETGTPFITPGE